MGLKERLKPGSKKDKEVSASSKNNTNNAIFSKGFRERTRLPTVTGKRIGKAAFWATFTFMFIGSTISFVHLVEPRQPVIQPKQEEPMYGFISEAELISYSKNFTHAFFTWKLTNQVQEGREGQLAKFLATGLDPQGGMSFENMKWNSSVKDIEPIEVKRDKGKAEVTLRIVQQLQLAEQSNPEGGAPTATPTETEKEVNRYFVVPIMIEDKNMVVYKLPRFIKGEQIKATYKVAGSAEPENAVKDLALKDDIETFLTTVFKVYTEGKPAELGYYFENPNVKEGLQGIMILDTIKNVKVYELGNKVYRILTEVTFKDKDSQIVFSQQYDIELIKKEGKFTIRSLQQYENKLEKTGGK